jgi:hypothetical protein
MWDILNKEIVDECFISPYTAVFGPNLSVTLMRLDFDVTDTKGLFLDYLTRGLTRLKSVGDAIFSSGGFKIELDGTKLSNNQSTFLGL